MMLRVKIEVKLSCYVESAIKGTSTVFYESSLVKMRVLWWLKQNMSGEFLTLLVYVNVLLNFLQPQYFTKGVLSLWIGFPWTKRAVYCVG